MMASVLEKNLTDTILSLFEHHSMTSNGTELRTLKNTATDIWITFHLDLEQWNYTFRPFQQLYVTAFFDIIFGVNHYSQSMWMFLDSILFTADKYAPPGTANQLTWWNDHAGGN